jgi:hypothetical protein
LPIVTVVPNEVRCPALLVQQAVQRFHTITIYKKNTVIIYSYLTNRKATTASQSAPFTPRPEGRVFSEQIW